MIDSNATARLHEEIGTDPVAYEAKIRAKIEAERGADPPPVSPAAGLPPSLANARSRRAAWDEWVRRSDVDG